mmetsp:Transcript_93795/g.274636  ORF Transcript_93795/g.274636 Transcript_93795/m.274636 type:complete len:274 (+) Transcript_93795:1496-2317(+)
MVCGLLKRLDGQVRHALRQGQVGDDEREERQRPLRRAFQGVQEEVGDIGVIFHAFWVFEKVEETRNVRRCAVHDGGGGHFCEDAARDVAVALAVTPSGEVELKRRLHLRVRDGPQRCHLQCNTRLWPEHHVLDECPGPGGAQVRHRVDNGFLRPLHLASVLAKDRQCANGIVSPPEADEQLLHLRVAHLVADGWGTDLEEPPLNLGAGVVECASGLDDLPIAKLLLGFGLVAGVGVQHLGRARNAISVLHAGDKGEDSKFGGCQALAKEELLC